MQILLIALPLAAVVAWLKMSLYVLRPFAIDVPRGRFARFSLVDLGCLLVELSFAGMLVMRYVESQLPNEIASDSIAVLVLILVEVGAIWWLSVRCLAAREVRSSSKRIVFELFVVPVAAYFPLIFAVPALVTDEISQTSLGIGAVLAVVALAASICLARWVARDGQIETPSATVNSAPFTPKNPETST